MICPNCGAKIDDDKLYCEVCGTEIQLIPDYEPLVESSITESLSDLQITDLDDTKTLNDFVNDTDYEYQDFDESGNLVNYSDSNDYSDENIQMTNEGVYADNEYSTSEYTDDNYSDENYSEEFSGNQYTHEEYLNQQYTDDEKLYANEVNSETYNGNDFSEVNSNEYANTNYSDETIVEDYSENQEAYSDLSEDDISVQNIKTKKSSNVSDKHKTNVKSNDANNLKKNKNDVQKKAKKISKEEKERALKRKNQLEYIRHDNDKPRLSHSLSDSLYYEVPSEEELEYMNEECEYDPFDDFAYESYLVKKFFELFKNKKTRPFVILSMILIVLCLVIGINSISRKIYQSSNFDYQIEQANIAVEEGDYNTAISYLEKAIGINPSATSVKFDLSDYYFKISEDDNAILILWDIINQKDYNAATAYKRIIDYYSSQNNFDKIQEILLSCEDKNIVNQFQNYLALAPEFNFEEGTYGEEIYLEMSSLSDGKIYYTLDGSEPTRDSNVYNSPLFFEMGVHKVKAMFINSYGVESDMVEKSYTIDIKVPKAPIVMLESGDYDEPQIIEVDYQSSCTVYYTTDGTVPNSDSKEYENPITLPYGESHYIFVSYSQEGNPGEPTEVKYNFNVETEFDIDVAVAQLNLYDYNIGRAADISGHLAGMTNVYQYPVKTIIWGEDKGDEKIEDLDLDQILNPGKSPEEIQKEKEKKEKQKEEEKKQKEEQKEKEEKEKEEKEEKEKQQTENQDNKNIDRDNNPNTKPRTNIESHEGQCLYYVFVEHIVDSVTGTDTKTGNIFLGKLDTGNLFCGKVDEDGKITVADMIQPEFFQIPEIIINPEEQDGMIIGGDGVNNQGGPEPAPEPNPGDIG